MDISHLDSVCMGCMKELKKPGGYCTSCGWNNNLNNNPEGQLPIFTVLNGKYIVGRVLERDDNSVTYLGMELIRDVKVSIKECFPEACVTRDAASSALTPCEGEKGNYFISQRDSFLHEANRLSQLFESGGSVGLLDFFRENGTAYIVADDAASEAAKRFAPVQNVAANSEADTVTAQSDTDSFVTVALPADAETTVQDIAVAQDFTSSVSVVTTPVAKPKKKKKLGLIIAAVLAVAAIAVALVIILPQQARANDYSEALAMIAASDYAGAKEKLAELPEGYEDSDRLRSYVAAMEKYLAGNVDEARTIFVSLGNYKDCANMVLECDYISAKRLMDAGDYEAAKTALAALGGFNDSAALIDECNYQQAKALMESGSLDEAKALFNKIPAYKDSADMIVECDYRRAKKLMDAGEYLSARSAFQALGSYSDSAALVKECTYLQAKKLMEARSLDEARSLLESLKDYKDSAELIIECDYIVAKDLFDAGKYAEAYEAFKAIKDYSNSSEMAIACAGFILTEALEDADKLAEQLKKFEEEFPGTGESFAKDHAKEIYNMASKYIGQLSFSKANDMFSLILSYSDAKTLASVCAKCVKNTGASDRVEALKAYTKNSGVKKALMSSKLFKTFMLGKWTYGSKDVLTLKSNGDVTYSSSVLTDPGSVEDPYDLNNDGSGIYYTYKGDKSNKQNWFKVTIIDGTHISVYVYKTGKTYELTRK